jgi:hypothetical protein
MQIIPAGVGNTVFMGPFLSNSDFKTPLTGLTSSSGNLLLFAGSTYGDISARTFAHVAGGVYSVALLSSDVSAAGNFTLEGVFSTAVPIAKDFMAVAANFWAGLVGSGLMGVNAAAIAGATQAATNLGQGALATVPFTAQSGSSSTVINTNLSSTTSANYNGRTVIFITGALAGQGATITGYNGSTFQLTVTTLTGAPSAGDTAVIV